VPTSSAVGRIAAIAALVGAVIVVLLLVLGGGSSYTVTAEFENASQLVTGNTVNVAGVPVGSIDSISLSQDGQALVKMDISDSAYTPLPAGTHATIRSQSLSGIANRYVQLDIPPKGGQGREIKSGGDLPQSQTVSEVDLDQLFNTLDPKTIGHFKEVIKGFARAYEGIGPQTGQGFHYLNPFLSSSREVFSELTADTERFRGLIIHSSKLTGALASKSPDLTQLVSNLDQMMGALASENTNLARAVGDLPEFMREFNTTSVNLRATLDDLTPLVNASKPVAVKLKPFTRQLRGFAIDAVPTVTDLDQIVKRPGKYNDLLDLTRLQPQLAKWAVGPVFANGKQRQGALPEARQSLVDSLPQLSFLRPYLTTDAVSGWFNDFGPSSGIADANGGIGRIQTTFNSFSAAASGGLLPDFTNPQLPLDLPGFQINQRNRCPGANERNPGDNSTPFTDNGTLDCDPSEVPEGP
jgi:phospholipid/cholesterol/gamma-HCH transport system substrate-binding protein